jgi:hypothetical protein
MTYRLSRLAPGSYDVLLNGVIIASLVVHPVSHAALGSRAIPGERRGRCRRRLPQTKGWRCAFQ